MIKGIGKRIQELRNERELTMDMLVADLNQRYEMEKPPSNKANDVYTPIVELLTYNVSCNKKRGTPTGASVLYHIYVFTVFGIRIQVVVPMSCMSFTVTLVPRFNTAVPSGPTNACALPSSVKS